MLTGGPLELAKDMKAARAEDLNENEIVYIDRCVYEDEQRKEREKQNAAERRKLQKQTEDYQEIEQRRRRRATIVAGVTLLAIIATGWWGYRLWAQQISLGNAFAMTERGDEDAEKENFDEAIKKYTEAISINPSYEVAYYRRGRAYLEKRQFDKAHADFDAAIKLKADYAVAYVGRGDAYRLSPLPLSGRSYAEPRRELDMALADYNRAIELEPRLSDAYRNRGKVLAEQRNPDQALADYNRAIELSNDDPTAFLWRGAAYSMSGNYDRASDDFNRALTLKQNLKQDLSDVYINRGNAHLRRGDNGQAITEYSQALGQILYDPEVYYNRGFAYQNTGQDQLASDDYQQAFNLSQDKPEYSRINADASRRLKEIQANRTSMAHKNRGIAFLKRGGPRDNERAINEFTRALERIQYDPEVYLNRGVAYQNTGNAQLAGADYGKALTLSQDKPEHSSTKAEASRRLKEIQAPPPEDRQAPPRIHLRYQDRNDLAMLDKIADALKNQSNYKVVGRPEGLTQATTGEVRYFHKEDEPHAVRVKQIVERTLNNNRISKTIELRPLLRLSKGIGAPQGWIEVWLPSLPPPGYRPGIKNDPAKSASEAQQQSYKPIKD
jgi:tetratricopeptide (TPR) repeat protein